MVGLWWWAEVMVPPSHGVALADTQTSCLGALRRGRRAVASAPTCSADARAVRTVDMGGVKRRGTAGCCKLLLLLDAAAQQCWRWCGGLPTSLPYSEYCCYDVSSVHTTMQWPLKYGRAARVRPLVCFSLTVLCSCNTLNHRGFGSKH